MDFELEYASIEVTDASLSSRSNLWLLKVLHEHSKIEFDNKLTNRLRLIQKCLIDVKFDITQLVDANVLTSSNMSIKRSFGSLLLWLYEFLDTRTEMMIQNSEFLAQLNAKLIRQLKIYPSIFSCAYYKTNSTTTFFTKIRLSTFQSQRLDHILEFHQLIDDFNRNQSKFPSYSTLFLCHLLISSRPHIRFIFSHILTLIMVYLILTFFYYQLYVFTAGKRL